MSIVVTTSRRPGRATVRQSIAATGYFGVLPAALLTADGKDTPVAYTARRMGANLQSILLCDRLRRQHAGAPVWLRIGTTPMMLVIHREDVRAIVDGVPHTFAVDARRSATIAGRSSALALSRQGGNEPYTMLAQAMSVAAKDSDTSQIVADHASAMLKAHHRQVSFEQWRWMHLRFMRHILIGEAAAHNDEPALIEVNERRTRGPRTTRYGGDNRRTPLTAPLPSGTDVQFDLAVNVAANALAVNTFRAFQLLTARPPVCIGPLYLKACLRESSRLWPTVSGLIRKTTTDTIWGGQTVSAGSHLLIANCFGHRDRRRIDFADEFVPSQWLPGGHAVNEPLFNGFGHQRSKNSAQDLALICGASVLSTMIEASDWRPVSTVVDGSHRIDYEPPAAHPVLRSAW